ncbi:glycosyltransferase, partial [Phytoactinopolyspora endophytica]|uniref:glycosyltransferase n=1 Tax=Phytoactinopolyspora endophytica TaxID=1642495 RepID=UPI00101DFA55
MTQPRFEDHETALPPGFGLRLDPATAYLHDDAPDSPGVLMGGTPFRIVRLSTEHDEAMAGWQDGAPVGAANGTGDESRRFARALVETGMAQPIPPAEVAAEPVTVIIPVRDRAGELDRLLRAIRAHEATDPVHEIIVVDDASADAQAHQRTA